MMIMILLIGLVLLYRSLIDQTVSPPGLILQTTKSIYINNETPVHDQGNEGICYAMASSTFIRNQLLRNNEKPLSHQQLVKMQREDQKKKYGTDIGATDDQMKEYIENYFRENNIDYKVDYITVQETSKALKQNKSPIINFLMTYNQWEQFKSHCKKNPLLPFELKPPQLNDKSKLGGHACVIVGQNEEDWIVKNSWGQNHGDKGHFRLLKKSFNSKLPWGFKMCRIISSTPLNPTKTQELLKMYSQTTEKDIVYKGGIKIGGKLGQNHSFMSAKDKKNDQKISQQQDLIKVNHKNINKIENIHYDRKQNKPVIFSQYYDINLAERQKVETITGMQKAYITRDCLSALSFLQQNLQRNHGDISSNNIVFEKNSKTAKLHDFDLSKKFKSNEQKQFNDAKIKDTEKLNQAVYKNQDNDKQSKKVNSILENNKGQHKNSRNKIEQEVILVEYKKQAKFQKKCHYVTTIFNILNAVAHDIHQNGFTKNTVKTAARELSKGGMEIVAHYGLEEIVTQKILQKPENYNYRGGSYNYAFMAVTEIGKEGVDFLLGIKQVNKQQMKKSGKRVVGSTVGYIIKQQTTYIVSRLLEEIIFGQVAKKITIFSSQVIGESSSLIMAGLSAFGVNAISSLVGFGIDYFYSNDFQIAATNSFKYFWMTLTGSCIGAGIGSVVPVIGTAFGRFLGGLIGGVFASWSKQIQQINYRDFVSKLPSSIFSQQW